jgi:pyruvate formate lyase activating enzyme
MKLGGLRKSSLIDYPGHVSCVIFLSGCNFHCPYCQNPDLVGATPSNSYLYNEKAVFRFLEQRKGLLDGVVLSGGEPTLQKGLLTFCEKIKKSGYPIKLDTNGSRPHVIKQLIEERLVDFVAMDIKADPDRYPPQLTDTFNRTKLLTSIRIIMDSASAYEFRTTCAKPFIRPQSIEKIAKTIKGATLYMLQQVQNQRTLNPSLFEGAKATYTGDELLHLKVIAEQWVKKCLIR